MIIKLTGCVIVFMSSVFLGYYLSMKDFYRINDLREIKKALFIILSEIDYSISTVPEAIFKTSEKVKEPISEIFKYLSYELSKKSGESLDKVWKHVLNKKYSDTYLKEEDVELLEGFGKTLGYLDKKMQINNINITIGYIDRKIDEIYSQALSNKKMYKSLGILCGIGIVIVLF